MEADNAVNTVISSVKKSNLNFFIQESPFSLCINIRKTFIKNKEGHILHPPTSAIITDDTDEQRIKVEKLEEENRKLSESVEQLVTELSQTRNALYESNIRLEKAETETLAEVSRAYNANKEVKNLQKENEALIKKTNGLQVNIETLKDEKNSINKNKKLKENEVTKLEIKNNNLDEKLKHLESENSELKEKFVFKNDEMMKLEEKMKSLLDILYGCHECGLCECECSDSVSVDCGSYLPPQCATTLEPSSPPASAQRHPSQPSSCPSSWTPPPTPPCISCGGANFGPCPGSVCFACIPPLTIQPEASSNSPSRTPPGTPPLLRIEHRPARTRPGEIGLE